MTRFDGSDWVGRCSEFAASLLVGWSVMSGAATARELSSSRDAPGRPDAAPCPKTAALPIDAARALVAKVAAEEDFYPTFVLSVAKVESRFDSTALSDKGAYGLMQLTPETARRFAVDLCDPEANVRGGIRFLRALHGRYRNPLFILAAYNAGEEVVRRTRGVPPYPETVRFVADVVNDFYRWPVAAGPRDEAPSASKVRVSASLPNDAGRDDGETAAPAPLSLEAPPSPEAARWNGGFVLHFD